MNANAIAALTALARSDSLDATLPALERVRAILGEEAERYRPLLETLTLKAQELSELKREARALSSELRLRRSRQAG